MVIKLGGTSANAVTFTKILEWSEVYERKVPRKAIVYDSGVHVDDSTNIRPPTEIEIDARVTPAEKTQLFSLEAEKSWQPLEEDDALLHYVWIERVVFDWKRVEHADSYWRASIGLILYGV